MELDPIDAMCRALKQFRDNGSEPLKGKTDADLVGIAWEIYLAGEREREGKKRDSVL